MKTTPAATLKVRSQKIRKNQAWTQLAHPSLNTLWEEYHALLCCSTATKLAEAYTVWPIQLRSLSSPSKQVKQSWLTDTTLDVNRSQYTLSYSAAKKKEKEGILIIHKKQV